MPANDPGNNQFDANPFNRTYWKEQVAGMQPGGGDTFGLEESDVVLVGYIPWATRFSFIRNVLGYSYVQPAAAGPGGTLKRVLPVFHPWYEWMAAYQVHLQAQQPDPTQQYIAGVGNVLATKINAPNPALEFDFAGYKNANCAIRFRQQPWEYIADGKTNPVTGQPFKEYERYIYETDSGGELTVFSQTRVDATKQPTFAEGPSDAAPPLVPVANPKGVAYAGEFPFYAYKETVNLRWMYVPKDFVCLDGTFKKPKISRCVGRVNLTKFMGYERGELLLNPPQYQRFLFPLRVVGFSSYGYNITLPMTSFSPPKGVSTSTYFGHDLLPYNVDGLWYLATRGGATADARMIPAAEFADIFTHAAAP